MTSETTIRKNHLLTAILTLLLAGGISAFSLSDKADLITKKGLELIFILFTICFQLFVIFRTKRYYTSSKLNLYFIHPAIYINIVVISFFFLPLVYYLFNSDFFYKWLDLENILIPLAFFCLSIVILNILFIFFDKKTRSFSGEIEAFDQIINVFRQGLPILIAFYALSWFTRILTVLIGTYSLLLADSELIHSVKVQHPLLLPAFMFFNGEIYFPVFFILWILYFTVFKSNKKYKLVMIMLLIADILYFSPTGTKQFLLQPILAYGLAGLMLKQKVFKKLIIIGLVFILSLPIHNAYRTLGGTLHGSLEYIRTTELEVYGEQKGYLFAVADASFRRADAFSNYFYFIQMVENNFMKGATYSLILSRLLPDFLLPLPDYLKDKSTTIYAQDYGLISINERLPAGAPAAWGEFYLNFGYTGLVIGFPLLGIFCLFIFRNVLRGRKLNNFLIYSYIPVAFLFLAHSLLAALITPLIKIAVVLFTVNFIAKLSLKKQIRSLQEKS